MDWIKTSIARILRNTSPGRDVRVLVEAVPYGAFLWCEGASEHVHVSSKDIRWLLGSDGPSLTSFEEVRLTWSDVREACGRPSP